MRRGKASLLLVVLILAGCSKEDPPAPPPPPAKPAPPEPPLPALGALKSRDCVGSEDGTTEQDSEKSALDDRMYFPALFALRRGTRDLTPGKITTRVAGYFKVGRYECARLESEFEIATEKPSDRLLLRGRV